MPQVHNVRRIVREIALGLRQPTEFEAYDPEEVRREKAELPWRGSTVLTTERQVDTTNATAEYVATCEVVDRMGDLVLTRPRNNLGLPQQDGTVNFGEGFLTANFMLAGAPFLWSHLSRDHAVGQVTGSRQAKVDAGGKKVWGTLQTVRYLTDERIPLAVPTLILVAEGIARAVSVGFAPTLTLWVPDEQTKVKLGLGRWGVVYLTSDQLELSQAQTPANPFAVDPNRGKEAMDSLERAVAEGRTVGGVKMSAGLLADFRRECELTPEEGIQRMRERARGFLDLGALELPEAQEEEPAERDEPEAEPETAPGPVASGHGGSLPEGLRYQLEEDHGTGMVVLSIQGERGSREAVERALARLAEPIEDDLEAELDATSRAADAPPAQPVHLPAAERALLSRAFDALSVAGEAIAELCERTDDPASRSLDMGDGEPQDIAGLVRATLDTTRRVLAIVEDNQADGGAAPGGHSGAGALDEIQELFGG